GDRATGEGDRERLRPDAAAAALRTGHAPDEAHRPVAHPLALGVGEHVHDVLAGAPEFPVVAVVDAAGFGRDQDGRLLVGVEQPVPVLLAEERRVGKEGSYTWAACRDSRGES